jgi:hypothetical protein
MKKANTLKQLQMREVREVDVVNFMWGSHARSGGSTARERGEQGQGSAVKVTVAGIEFEQEAREKNGEGKIEVEKYWRESAVSVGMWFCKVKGKAVPVTGRGCPQDRKTSRFPHIIG